MFTKPDTETSITATFTALKGLSGQIGSLELAASAIIWFITWAAFKSGIV